MTLTLRCCCGSEITIRDKNGVDVSTEAAAFWSRHDGCVSVWRNSMTPHGNGSTYTWGGGIG